MSTHRECFVNDDDVAALQAQLIERMVEEQAEYFALHEPQYDYCKSDLAGRFQLFLRNYDTATPEELTRTAKRVLIGHPDDYGRLIRDVRDELPGASPLLLAAGLRLGWHPEEPACGVLPDPGFLTADKYGRAIEDTLAMYACVRSNPRRILTNLAGRDLDFFGSLPELETIYRGCRGISPETAAAGICWTTKRTTAEWFASQSEQAGLPVLVSAQIGKAEIVTVFARQHEVVCQPTSFNELECREVTASCLPIWGDESF